MTITRFPIRRTLLTVVACTAALLTVPALAAGDMPTGKELFQGHIKAVGGEKALKSQTDRTIIGRFQMPAGGIDAEMTIKQKAPNMVHMSIDIPGMGNIQQGYNGKVAWSLNPMQGPSLLEGEQLKEFQEQADFYVELNYEKHYSKLGAVEEATFEGKPAYKLSAVTTGGKDKTIYFDKSSGLVVGSEGLTESDMGPTNVRSVVSDYKKVGDVLIPHMTTSLMTDMGMEQIIKITSISLDTIDRKTFMLPAEIKALTESAE